MKNLLILALAAVISCLSVPNMYSQQQDFFIKTDKDTITLKTGETAVFNISVTVPKDFDASLFLSVAPNENQLQYSTISLAPATINAPYLSKLTVSTTENYSKGGVYRFTLTATNKAELSTEGYCYVKIVGTKPSVDSNWLLLPHGSEESPSIPYFITQDGNGSYWYSTFDYRFRKVSSGIYAEQWGSKEVSKFNITFVPPIIDVNNNKIWIPSYRDGLVRYTLDGKNQTIFNKQNSPIPDDRIMEMAIDTVHNKGALWIGTRYGLARFDGSGWTVFDSTNSVLTNEQITGIRIADSIVWIGTRDGLVKYDGTTWARYTPENSAMPAAFVHNMAVEKNGTLWLGLSPKGVFIDDQAIPNRMVGLARFDGVNWKLYDRTNSLIDTTNYVNSIFIDKKGNKWLGSGQSGMVKFNDTIWTAYKKQNSLLPDNFIGVECIDRDDNVWFVGRKFWGVFNENGLPKYFTSVRGGDIPEVPKEISVFPNPAMSSFTIVNPEGFASYRVLNSVGVEVLTTQGMSGRAEVDVSSFPSGLYFVSVRSSGRILVKPLVVSH